MKRFAVWLLIAAHMYVLWLGVQVLWLKVFEPRSTAFMEVQEERLQATEPPRSLRYIWVEQQAISSHLKRAVLASEDAKFFEHSGFDWDGIHAALKKNLAKGRLVAGGSTLSQQLAKNLFLSADRTLWRKANEALITVLLEVALDKQRIFELYLNVIEWGDGIFGAEAAAQHYFGVSAARLNAAQAAKLAAMIPNPRYYDAHRQDRRLLRKTRVILQRMPAVRLTSSPSSSRD